MLKTLAFCLVIAGLVIYGITGCAQQTGTTENTGSDNPDVYSIKIYLNDTLKKSITVEDLQKLEQVSFSTENKDESGPTLLSVLKLAGIDDFSQVTAVGLGKGRLTSAELVLTRDQVDDTVILDLTNQGTAKVAGLNISSNDWIIDVSELRVK